jgi:hypothetical protein
VQVAAWVLLALNVSGAAIMVKYGLPREVPFVGRHDADPLMGYLGLLLFGSSVAIRVAIIATS